MSKVLVQFPDGNKLWVEPSRISHPRGPEPTAIYSIGQHVDVTNICEKGVNVWWECIITVIEPQNVTAKNITVQRKYDKQLFHVNAHQLRTSRHH